jgi:hypothetical protein
MGTAKVRCWEFMECPPEIYKFCPAHILRAGRKCWFVAGTFCGSKVRGINALKLTSCEDCKFYQHIHLWDKLS